MRSAESEFILNKDGSVYHLDLLPGDIADHIVLVGDPDRVGQVSRFFDSVEVVKGKREFITHTGLLMGLPVTVMSTGIGTDNIDIVVNELDALVNMDFSTKSEKETLKSLKLLRIGTCGALQPEVMPGTPIRSVMSFGFDSLMSFYNYSVDADKAIYEQFEQHLSRNNCDLAFYLAPCTADFGLASIDGATEGITATLPGFYGPQARRLRSQPLYPRFQELLASFSYKGLKLSNIEMESSGLFALAGMLGHQAETICLALANRTMGAFASSSKTMDKFIQEVLNQFVVSSKLNA